MVQKAKEIIEVRRSGSAETLEAALVLLAQQLESLGSVAGQNPSIVKNEKRKRTPGRFKGALAVGPEFFEPLSEDELREFEAE
ncbi:hypothetical protein [uncultured Agrobacterium sp.]|uniref:hypothetical protein n=1 Tax=uncultured Agrobacterium sp. TaxID=157277 RepID=UPI00258AE267|nr:hypothetical protein [uncultured Agrobacterium sp.]